MKNYKIHRSLFALTFLAITASQGNALAAVDIDIRNFGVACNGTTDDSSAFQAALNALPASGGGTLRIPCRLGLRSGVRIANKSDIVITGSAAGAGFKALGAAGGSIPAFGPILLIADKCNRCTIQNLDIEIGGQSVGAIGVTGSTEAKVINNTIRNTGYMSGGAISGSGNTRNQYTGNTILTTVTPTRGLWIGNAWDAALDWHPLIANNTVRNVKGTGIVIHSVAATVRGNTAEYSEGAGIKVVPPAVPTGLTTVVEGNNLRHNLFNGLQVSHGHDMTIRSNTIELNRGAGVYADYGQFNNILFEQNIVRNNDLDYRSRGWQTGLLIHVGNNITIRGNTFEDTRSGASKTQTNGMWLNSALGAISNVRIEQNTFRNNLLSGIHVSGPNPIPNVIVAGNTFVSNPDFAVAFSAGIPSGSMTFCNNDVIGGKGDLLPTPSVPIAYSPCSISTPTTPPPATVEPTPTTPPPTTGTKAFVTQSSNSGVRSDYQGWVGARFTTGGSPVTITALGRIVVSGNSRTHTVKLVAASGSDVPGASAVIATSGAPAGQIKYAALASPVELQANTTYIVASQETAGGDSWYDVQTSVATTSAAAVTSGAFSSDGRSWSYAGGNNRMYGPVSFLYK